jgi:hypothetical protein
MKKYLFTLFLLAFVAKSSQAAIGVTDIKNTTTLTACDGSATAYAHGTAGPFTYKWSNGKTTAKVTDLCVGLYTVTITSLIGCPFVHTVSIGYCQGESSYNPVKITSSTITNVRPDILEYQLDDVTVQFGSEINITTEFTYPPANPWSSQVMHYKWVNEANGLVVGSSQDLTNIPPGRYCVYVSNGCAGSPTKACYSVISCFNPSGWDPQINPIINVNELPVCIGPTYYGGGNLSASSSSGYPITAYQWSGPGGFTSSAQSITPSAGLGLYTVSLTNACNHRQEVSVPIKCCDDPALSSGNIGINNPCYAGWFNDDAWVTFTMPWQPTYACQNRWTMSFSAFPDATYEVNYVNGVWKPKFPLGAGAGWNADWKRISIRIPDKSLTGTFCATMQDDCGCAASTECAFFGDNDQASTGLVYGTLGHIQHEPGAATNIWGTNATLDLGWFHNQYAIYGCGFGDKPCGVAPGDVGLAHWFGLSDEIKYFSYQDNTPGFADEIPCKGGTITCKYASRTYEISPTAYGQPIINFDATPQSGPNGQCIYPMGCLFPAGIIDNMPDAAPVFVMNPEGYSVPNGGCEPPNDAVCGGTFPPMPFAIPNKPCMVRYICLETNTVVGEVSFIGEKCKCGDDDGICTLVAPCDPQMPVPFSQNGSCQSSISFNEVPCQDTAYDWCPFPKPPGERSDQINLPKHQHIKVFPNPTNGTIFVDFSGTNTRKELEGRIYNAFGDELLKRGFDTQDVNPIEITSFKNYPPGVYFLAFDLGKRVVLKVIKTDME